MRTSGLGKEVRHAGKTSPIEAQSRAPQVSSQRRANGTGCPKSWGRHSGSENFIRDSRSTDDENLAAQLNVSDVQLIIARESGFLSWARLKRHIEKATLSDQRNLPHHERIEDATFRRGVELLDAGDAAGLRAHLKQHQNLAHQRVVFEGGNYFRNPTLLEFVAENPVRRGTLPSNIVEVTQVILEAGIERSALNETLGLVCSGCVSRECRVQIPLIDLLCDHGADPNSAIQTALAHGEFEAVNALIQRGARVSLP